MLEASRREANELYTLFHLLAEGKVAMGDAKGNPGKEVPIVLVERQEHDGARRYEIGETEVRIHGTQMDVRYPRKDFGVAADFLLQELQKGGEVLRLDDLERFLDALKIYDMEARTEDRTDLHVTLWNTGGPRLGLRIQSRLCGYLPLLDGGRTANLKWEQTGIRFSAPAVNKINWTEHPENVAEVARRILYIQSVGGFLKFNDVADKVFRSNLLMLDTNLPRILGTMVMALHLDGTSKVDELVKVLEEKNPLKLKDELVKKHGFYGYKVRQFLLAAAWGMRPGKMFTGIASAISGYLMVDSQGGMLLYSRQDEQTFSDYLLTHTRLEKGLPDEDKYGYLERENGAYYLKLNLKLGLRKNG